MRAVRLPKRVSPGQIALGLVDDPIAIRDLVSDSIRSRFPAVRLVPEMGMGFGSGRIDLAAIGHGLDGYEIKSGRDDLNRLAGQARTYATVFDSLTLVAATNHLAQAAAQLPEWWGLAAIEPSLDRLIEIRRPKTNPERDPLAVAGLLWKDELAALVQGSASLRRATRQSLCRHLASSMPLDDLVARVCVVLRQREGWRAAA